MASTQPRHDVITICRRFGESSSAHAIKQLYDLTYPGHTEPEEGALRRGKAHDLLVWYEENVLGDDECERRVGVSVATVV